MRTASKIAIIVVVIIVILFSIAAVGALTIKNTTTQNLTTTTSSTSSSLTTQSSSTSSSSSQYSVTISYAQNPIVRGNYQTIYVSVISGGNPVANLGVQIYVVYASQSTTKTFQAMTNSSGIADANWLIGGNSNPGTFSVTATIQGQTYNSSFQVNSS